MRKLLDVILLVLLFASTTLTSKNYNSLKSLISNKSHSTTSVNYPANYLEGWWIAHFYGCFGGKVDPQELYGETINGKFIMTKTVGDGCVTNNHISFMGTLPSGFDDTQWGVKCTWTTGYPALPNSGTDSDCALYIKDMNMFYNRTMIQYIRISRSQRINGPDYYGPLYFDKMPYNYFLGYWQGTGYSCGSSKNMTEDIIITYENGLIVAKKIIGNNCVGAGKISWTQSLSVIPNNSNWIRKAQNDWGIQFCTITLESNPTKPTTQGCAIIIKDINKFEIPYWKMTYTRGSSTPQKKVTYPQNYFNGKWKGIGFQCDVNMNLTQIVDVTNTADKFYAKMVDGNNCVNKGMVTLTAFMRPNWTADVNSIWDIACTLITGTSTSPQSSFNECLIQIVDTNTFTIWPQMYNFTRVVDPTPAPIAPTTPVTTPTTCTCPATTTTTTTKPKPKLGA